MDIQWAKIALEKGGFPGLVVLALGLVVRSLYLDLREQMRAKDARILELERQLAAEHSARLADQKETTSALLASAVRYQEGVSHLHEIARAVKK